MSKIEAIVLNEIRFKETSKILNIYTRELGRISIMARGAYRPKSNLTAYTQVFSHCNYEVYKGRSWYYLNEGDVINSFYNIRDSLERTSIGFYILELIYKSTAMEEKNEILFDFLVKSLKVLETLEDNFLEFLLAFQVKYISFIGYRPYLSACVGCGKKSLIDSNFSIPYGGILCSNCRDLDLKSFKLNMDIYKSLLNLMYIKLDEISDLKIDKKNIKKVYKILNNYILYNIDREDLNSLDMIELLLI